MLFRIANREDPDQTASSDLGLHCLSSSFWQATSVRNFRTFTVFRVTVFFMEKEIIKNSCTSSYKKYVECSFILSLPIDDKSHA